VEELLRGRAGCSATSCYVLVRAAYRRLGPEEAAAAAAGAGAEAGAGAGQGRWSKARRGAAAGGRQQRAQLLARSSGWDWGTLWGRLLRWLGGGAGKQLERAEVPGGGGGVRSGGGGAGQGGDEQAWQQLEEVPVLLASPKELPLQDPQLAAGDFRQVGHSAGLLCRRGAVLAVQ
jgi:hypothetical protein